MPDEPLVARTQPEAVRELGKPLDAKYVEHLKDKQNAPYLETYQAINQANRIFGFGAWTYHVARLECVHSRPAKTRNGSEYQAETWIALVRVTALGVTREDVGVGQVVSPDPDMGIKGAVSDGLKRALRTFGPQFGNDLYDKDGDRPTPQEATQARQQEASAQAADSTWQGFLKTPVPMEDLEKIKAITIDADYLSIQWTSLKGFFLWSAILCFLKLGTPDVTPGDILSYVHIYTDEEITGAAQLNAAYKDHGATVWRAAIIKHVGLSLEGQAADLPF